MALEDDFGKISTTAYRYYNALNYVVVIVIIKNGCASGGGATSMSPTVAGRPTPHCTTSLMLRMWNMWTMWDNAKSDCLERCTVIITREFEHANVDIWALSKTRREGDGQLSC